MANYTQDLILKTFGDMLERMPLDKITVTALIKECNIGRNTFYYHYEDIYALLDAVIDSWLGQYEDSAETHEWQMVMKSLLFACRENKKKIYHIFNSLSRDRLEHHVFDQTDNAISAYVHKKAEEKKTDPKRAEIIADIVKYSVYGYFLRFLWNDMKSDIEENVNELGAVFDDLLDRMLS